MKMRLCGIFAIVMLSGACIAGTQVDEDSEPADSQSESPASAPKESDSLRQEIDRLRSENQNLRRELQDAQFRSSRSEQERSEAQDLIRNLAVSLGIRAEKKDISELCDDIRIRLAHEWTRTRKIEELNEDEWEVIHICFGGWDEIVEKIQNYENFVKEYQKKKIIILEK